MTTFRRGDIALVFFPNSDLRTAKKRPVLIVDSNDLATGLPQRIVAMVSSNLQRANHPSRVLVSLDSEEGQRAGLLFDSVIMTDNLATVMTHELDRVIGHLSGMESINEALNHTLGLEISQGSPQPFLQK